MMHYLSSDFSLNAAVGFCNQHLTEGSAAHVLFNVGIFSSLAFFNVVFLQCNPMYVYSIRFTPR